MFDKIKITKEMAEEQIIGKKRTKFIEDLDELDNLLRVWANDEMRDTVFSYKLARKLDSIRRSITIYK
jgi:hypothetical protein